MIARRLNTIVLERLRNNASVTILGPRQVGKTTLAFGIAETTPSVYLDLENSTDLRKVEDIESFYRENKDRLVILDEVQRSPDLFTQIRGLIDAERRRGNRNGLFLFLGSASNDLLRQSSESLAGRISYVELFPIDTLEYLSKSDELDKLDRLWVRGGFPDSLLATDDENSLRWRRDFIRTYLERDVPMLGPRVPSATLERLWIMLAHSQGTNINASKLASALDVSSVSVSRYIDLLADLLLVRKLPPYTTNVKKRLVRSPKVFVRDSGTTHALLNIKDFNELLGHPVAGNSWEGFVIENIASILPFGAQVFYYRTAGGAEIDLLIEFSADEVWAIEIKRSSSARLGRGFYEACDDIGPARRFFVHAGHDTFTNREIQVISLYELMNLIVSK
ncbi:MAG: ATP-binding protein [Acidobacteria bacterium]|nr:ATP-binding protein [Acidobacteriota bacterium]